MATNHPPRASALANRVPLLFHGEEGLAHIRLAATVNGLAGRLAESLTPALLRLVYGVRARAA